MSILAFTYRVRSGPGTGQRVASEVLRGRHVSDCARIVHGEHERQPLEQRFADAVEPSGKASWQKRLRRRRKSPANSASRAAATKARARARRRLVGTWQREQLSLAMPGLHSTSHVNLPQEKETPGES